MRSIGIAESKVVAKVEAQQGDEVQEMGEASRWWVWNRRQHLVKPGMFCFLGRVDEGDTIWLTEGDGMNGGMGVVACWSELANCGISEFGSGVRVSRDDGRWNDAALDEVKT